VLGTKVKWCCEIEQRGREGARTGRKWGGGPGGGGGGGGIRTYFYIRT